MEETEEQKMEQRRQAMVERLNRRKKTEESIKAKSSNEVKELEDLLIRAEITSFDDLSRDEVVNRLQEKLEVVTQGYDATRIKKAIIKLRNQTRENNANDGMPIIFDSSTNVSLPKGHEPSISLGPSSSTTNPTKIKTFLNSDEMIVVKNYENKREVVSGKDGTEVLIQDVTGSTVFIDFRPSTVQIRNVFNSTIVCLPASSSVSIRNFRESIIYAAAHQIRGHNILSSTLCLATVTTVLLENCGECLLAPYQVSRKAEMIQDFPKNDNWKIPRDMDQLEGASGHWKIAEETAWKLIKY